MGQERVEDRGWVAAHDLDGIRASTGVSLSSA
jgi:hypothetical protein